MLKHILDFRMIPQGMQYYPTSAARRYYFGCAAPPRRKVENPFVFPCGRARGAGSAPTGPVRWTRVGCVIGLDPTPFQKFAFLALGPRGCTVTALNSSLRPPARRVVRLARRPA